MTFRVGSGYAEIDDERVSEVRGWDDSLSGSEVDTSIIGNVDANGRPVKRSLPGAAAQTLNLQMFYDPADAQQSQIEQGATGLTIVIFTGGNAVGQEKRTYTGCSVNTSATSGANFEGLVEYTANMSFTALTKTTIIA
jgi:hypothetical protein